MQLVRRRPRRPVKPAIGGSPTRQMEHILHMKLPRPLKPMPIAPDHGVQLVRGGRGGVVSLQTTACSSKSTGFSRSTCVAR